MTDARLGRALLAASRHSIAACLDVDVPTAPFHPALDEPGATFVTLTCGGGLRGCIGTLEAHRALGDDVRHNALGAAFRDPRFTPLTLREWAQVRIEVSLLGPIEPMEYGDEADLLAQLRPGTDGVVLAYGERRSTFLPQVWESLPEPSAFLGYLKRKAGLPADFWHAALRVARYEVFKWKEAETLPTEAHGNR